MHSPPKHVAGTVLSIAALLVGGVLACGASKEPSSKGPPRTIEVKAAPCPERDRLTADAVALAGRADAAPSDTSHDPLAVALATKLALHNAQHHAQDLTGDRRGFRALRPALVRAGGRSECPVVHALSLIYAESLDGGTAVDLWEGPARACATPGDVSLACTHSGGRLTPEQKERARALLREVWSKAETPAAKDVVMRGVEACSSNEKELETNLAFVAEDSRKAYVQQRHRERAHEQRAIDAKVDADMNARAAHSQCLETCGLFGFSASRESTLCDLCRGETLCVQQCNDASAKCVARCGGL